MKLNLSGVKAIKLNGKPLEGIKVSEVLADAINEHTNSIRWGRIAEDIYDEKDVDVSEQDVTYLINFVSSESCLVVIIFKKAILKYLESLIAVHNQPIPVN